MRVFTDGACSGNPGPGGWAWVADDGRSGSGGAAHSTNQRMEVSAVLEALRAVDGPIEIHSDSTYVVNCFNDRWYEGWLKRGWKNAQKKPVANRDLWEPLIELYEARRNELSFTWVKGHSGEELNEIADQMAVAAAEVQKDALATSVEDVDAPWAAGSAIWVVGATELTQQQRDQLMAAVRSLDADRDLVVSGLRRGAELEAAEAAVAGGLSLAVVLPFADPAASWAQAERDRFDEMIAVADHVVTLSGDTTSPRSALDHRNRWAAEYAVGAIVVGDEELADRLDDGGLAVVRG